LAAWAFWHVATAAKEFVTDSSLGRVSAGDGYSPSNIASEQQHPTVGDVERRLDSVFADVALVVDTEQHLC
jgi:hypothetical protein